MSNWQSRLDEEMAQVYPKMNEVHAALYETKPKEVGMIHPTLGTGVMLRTDGKIDAFADYNLGVKMNPSDNSLSVFASTIKIHSDNIVHVKYEDATYFTKEMAEIKNYVYR